MPSLHGSWSIPLSVSNGPGCLASEPRWTGLAASKHNKRISRKFKNKSWQMHGMIGDVDDV
jgi:hypothetical protein